MDLIISERQIIIIRNHDPEIQIVTKNTSDNDDEGHKAFYYDLKQSCTLLLCFLEVIFWEQFSGGIGILLTLQNEFLLNLNTLMERTIILLFEFILEVYYSTVTPSDDIAALKY